MTWKYSCRFKINQHIWPNTQEEAFDNGGGASIEEAHPY